ncbi:13805_t:CDS:10, partial [Acaulospora morrowiae]
MQIYGLVYEEIKAVPLQNVKVEFSKVVDMIAEVIIQQIYKNVENNLIEAVYKFPIYKAAAICGFEADIIDGHRTIKGIVKKSKDALFDEFIPYKCKTVVIKITYVTELKHDAESGQIRFVLPTTIAPRYGFPHGDDTSIQESISYSSLTSYHLDLNVTCRMASSIQKVFVLMFVSFGSHHDSLFPQSQLYSEDTLTQALDHAKSMDANYGGTEIYGPLNDVWDVRTRVELIRSNVKHNKDNVRLFSIGIGNYVSYNLVKSVARAGKGYAQYVTINERMDKKIIGMLKNAIKPPVKDYKIIWAGNESKYEDLDKEEAEIKPTISIFDKNPSPSPQDPVITDAKTKQAPFVIPPIYSGVRFYHLLHVSKGRSKIHTLAARKLIQDLDDGTSFIHMHPKNKGKPIPVSVIEEQWYKSVGKLFHSEKRENTYTPIISNMQEKVTATMPLSLCMESDISLMEVTRRSGRSTSGRMNSKKMTFSNHSAVLYSCFNKKEAKDFKEIDIDNEKILCTALAIEYLEVVIFRQFKDECEMCWEKANKALKKLVEEKEFNDVLKKARDWILKW